MEDDLDPHALAKRLDSSFWSAADAGEAVTAEEALKHQLEDDFRRFPDLTRVTGDRAILTWQKRGEGGHRTVHATARRIVTSEGIAFEPLAVHADETDQLEGERYISDLTFQPDGSLSVNAATYERILPEEAGSSSGLLDGEWEISGSDPLQDTPAGRRNYVDGILHDITTMKMLSPDPPPSNPKILDMLNDLS